MGDQIWGGLSGYVTLKSGKGVVGLCFRVLRLHGKEDSDGTSRLPPTLPPLLGPPTLEKDRDPEE